MRQIPQTQKEENDYLAGLATSPRTKETLYTNIIKHLTSYSPARLKPHPTYIFTSTHLIAQKSNYVQAEPGESVCFKGEKILVNICRFGIYKDFLLTVQITNRSFKLKVFLKGAFTLQD